MKKYKPISCSLYDELELFAMRGLSVTIELRNSEIIEDSFMTFESRKDKGEFAILKSGREIRLDDLARVENIQMNGKPS